VYAISNSDIWRDFPRFIVDYAFKLIYISSQEGCQTSVAAAVTQDLGEDGETVYLQPYPIVWNVRQPAFPPWEMLAPYYGPCITKPRLPAHDGGVGAAAAFWQASQEITGAEWPDV